MEVDLKPAPAGLLGGTWAPPRKAGFLKALNINATAQPKPVAGAAARLSSALRLAVATACQCRASAWQPRRLSELQVQFSLAKYCDVPLCQWPWPDRPGPGRASSWARVLESCLRLPAQQPAKRACQCGPGGGWQGVRKGAASATGGPRPGTAHGPGSLSAPAPWLAARAPGP
jgi:hypothetical protein